MRRTANFTENEWNCKCPKCNKLVPHHMDVGVMMDIQLLREHMGVPLVLSSAFRCILHPSEADKEKPGQHCKGVAVDIRVSSGAMAAQIIAYAIKYLDVQGWSYSKRLGFVHLDWRSTGLMTWNY